MEGGRFGGMGNDALAREEYILGSRISMYDQLILVYFGSGEEPFNPSECGVINMTPGALPRFEN
jgi:hypothetical protein